jgi:hypothetical protein
MRLVEEQLLYNGIDAVRPTPSHTAAFYTKKVSTFFSKPIKPKSSPGLWKSIYSSRYVCWRYFVKLLFDKKSFASDRVGPIEWSAKLAYQELCLIEYKRLYNGADPIRPRARDASFPLVAGSRRRVGLRQPYSLHSSITSTYMVNCAWSGGDRRWCLFVHLRSTSFPVGAGRCDVGGCRHKRLSASERVLCCTNRFISRRTLYVVRSEK